MSLIRDAVSAGVREGVGTAMESAIPGIARMVVAIFLENAAKRGRLLYKAKGGKRYIVSVQEVSE